MRITNPEGRTMEIGPEHPDYQRLLEAQQRSGANRTKDLLIALGCISGGALCWWYNVHNIRAEHHYNLFLGLIAPSLIVVGVLWFSNLVGKQDPPPAEPRRSPLGSVLVVLGWIALVAVHFCQLLWM
jgi:hypothetical protein